MKKRDLVTTLTSGRHSDRFMLAILMTVGCLLCCTPAKAQDDEKLLMSITTLTDTLRFSVAADEIPGTLRVDYGNGNVKTFDIPVGVKTEIEGIATSPETERVVKVYGNENMINSFYCTYYGLTALDLSGCPKLTDITCDHNELTSLDISRNPELVWLNANDNSISNITFPTTSKIQTLWLNGNPINSINVSGMPELLDLRLIECGELRNLNVSSNPKLTRLEAPGTGIYSIDVSNNPELLILDVTMSNIYKIDVTKNTKLAQLGVGHLPNSNYKLSSLDVSNNPALFYLNASGNRLTEIDLSHNPELQALNIWENQLTSIDLTNNPKIKQIMIRDNYLNFNTLPINENLTYYIYNPQKPVQVAHEYAAGSQLDLSKEIYNPDYKIGLSLFLTSSHIYQDPGTPLEEGVDYEFENGIVKFLKIQNDSVYCAVEHEKFPDMVLKTTRFMVRNPQDIGKSSLAFEFTPDKEPASQLLIRMVAYNPDSKVEVDFGDGNRQEYKIGTSSSDYILGNLKGETVKVYTFPGTNIKELNLQSGSISSIDLTRMHGLQSLDLSDNKLAEIDLSKNFSLQTLKINRNQLTSLELNDQNMLTTLDCSENQLSNLTFGGTVRGISSLNCSSNNLEHLDVTSLYTLTNLQARNNHISEMRLFNNAELTTLYLDDNDLETLDLTYNAKLNFLSITGNYFKFSTIPTNTARYFTYNRQKDILIPSIGHTVNLSSEQAVHDVSSDTDVATVYVWKDASGKKLYEGDEYTISNGVTTFLGPDYDDLGEVYCEMTNQVYSGLTLKTTCIKPADLPSTVLAELDVRADAGTPVSLNMAAAKPTPVYVDFGDGNMKECFLKTTYRIFDATLGSEKKIKVYCYDIADAPVTVFSLMNLDLNSVDISNLTEVYCLNFCNTGLKSLDISKNLKIQELLMADNRFTEMDLSEHTEIKTLNVRNNRLTKMPSGLGNHLSVLGIDGNKLSEADFSQLPNLRVLSASNNNFQTLDLTNNINIQQADLSNNALKSVQLPENHQLTVLHLSNNNFRFSTLPSIDGNLYFKYSPQADIEATSNGNLVDLSAEYNVFGALTDYVWKDASGELKAGSDYKVENGVTEFLTKPEGLVTCMMTNSLYPDLTLCTLPINIDFSGIAEVNEDSDYSIRVSDNTIYIYHSTAAKAEIYNMEGQTVRNLGYFTGTSEVSGLTAGIYVIRHTIDTTTRTSKVIIK